VETQAVADVVAAVAATGMRAHVVHVSSGAGLALIAAARAAGLPVSGETCPHYLVLGVASADDGDTLVKVSPPVRSGEADLLWEGLRTGVLDLVVSDHSPCALTDKLLGRGDLEAAVGGIASLQIGLPLVWTAARDRGFTLVDVARWMAQRPAELAGLDSKGAIAVGRDADLCVLDPRATFVVERGTLAHRLTRTPYDGRRLTGVVTETWLAGSPVDLDRPRGRVLLRGHDTIPSHRRSRL
jgi:allantoinase